MRGHRGQCCGLQSPHLGFLCVHQNNLASPGEPSKLWQPPFGPQHPLEPLQHGMVHPLPRPARSPSLSLACSLCPDLQGGPWKSFMAVSLVSALGEILPQQPMGICATLALLPCMKGPLRRCGSHPEVSKKGYQMKRRHERIRASTFHSGSICLYVSASGPAENPHRTAAWSCSVVSALQPWDASIWLKIILLQQTLWEQHTRLVSATAGAAVGLGCPETWNF